MPANVGPVGISVGIKSNTLKSLFQNSGATLFGSFSFYRQPARLLCTFIDERYIFAVGCCACRGKNLAVGTSWRLHLYSIRDRSFRELHTVGRCGIKIRRCVVVKAGDEIVNPRTGQRMVFLQTGDETGDSSCGSIPTTLLLLP